MKRGLWAIVTWAIVALVLLASWPPLQALAAENTTLNASPPKYRSTADTTPASATTGRKVDVPSWACTVWLTNDSTAELRVVVTVRAPSESATDVVEPTDESTTVTDAASIVVPAGIGNQVEIPLGLGNQRRAQAWLLVNDPAGAASDFWAAVSPWGCE